MDIVVSAHLLLALLIHLVGNVFGDVTPIGLADVPPAHVALGVGARGDRILGGHDADDGSARPRCVQVCSNAAWRWSQEKRRNREQEVK